MQPCAIVLVAAAALHAAACAPASVAPPDGARHASAAAPPAPAPVASERFPAGMRLNDLQVIGTHNSYHTAPPTALYSIVSDRARAWQYTHAPIPQQLSEQNIRALEFDVYNDPAGGHFAQPFLGHGASPRLQEPGFKVFHVPSFDQGTRCVTLADALDQVAAWSKAHPSHAPIFIQLELKDGGYEGPAGYRIKPPPPFDAATLDALDALVRERLGVERLLTPDAVRGSEPTLRDAITRRGWPLASEAAGRVLCVLQASSTVKATYLDQRPSCEGRACFVDAEPGTPASAYIVVNDPLAQGPRIKRLVQAGYIVRTRADANLVEVRANDTRRRDAALASGAQVISTDAPVVCAGLKSAYVCGLPEGGCWRHRPGPPSTPPARKGT